MVFALRNAPDIKTCFFVSHCTRIRVLVRLRSHQKKALDDAAAIVRLESASLNLQ